MANIIDRRLNGGKKSSTNRQKFFRRVKDQIKDAVRKQIQDGSIKDVTKGGNVKINRRSVKEPQFHHGNSGVKKGVHPGNKEFHKGDQVKRPDGSGGGGGREGSPDGEGEDEFGFSISREEFLEIFFEDCELPAMVKTSLIQVDQFKWKRAGYSSEGVPAKMNIVRSVMQGLARQMALTSEEEDEIEEIEKQIVLLNKKLNKTNKKTIEAEIKVLEDRILVLKDEIDSVPFIDDIDLRYNLHVKEPEPATNAVMFCLMDVSGSMGEYEKDLAKRFFILLHLFLVRNYERVDVIFLRHHHTANEVDEETFFHDRDSGGTIVSQVLHLMHDIIQDRYSTSDWNIYAAQASDGDNWSSDNEECERTLMDDILPYVQHFAYIEVAHDPDSLFGFGDEADTPDTELWGTYDRVNSEYENMAMAQVGKPGDIYPVFRELFKKKGIDA